MAGAVRGQTAAMRRRGAAVLLAGAVAPALGGCLGGIPMHAQAKFAARSWAARTLHPDRLRVTYVSVARDQRRARVHLTADGRRFFLRLERPGGSWHVVLARPRSYPREASAMSRG